MCSLKNEKDDLELEEELFSALNRGDEATALNILERTGEIQDWNVARSMLNRALDCSAQLFDKLLDICPHGDYLAGRKKLPIQWAEYAGDRTWQPFDADAKVAGTIMMVAAALNKPEHIRALLKHGFAPDGNSLDSVLAMHKTPSSDWKDYDGMPLKGKARIRITAKGGGRRVYNKLGATPLAISLLFGNLECARVLLEHKKTVQMADKSVSAALMLPCRQDDEVYQTARRLVLCAGKPATNGQVKLNLSGAINVCSVEGLKAELLRCSYDESEIIEAIMCLGLHKPQNGGMEKLLCLEAYCPSAFRKESVWSKLLRAAAVMPESEKLCDLCVKYNEVIDVGSIFFGGMQLDCDAAYKRVLTYLSERRPCVIDRKLFDYLDAWSLEELWDYIRVLPGDGRVLSEFAKAVIETDDADFVRKMIDEGYFDTEPIASAIQYAGEVHQSFHVAKNPRWEPMQIVSRASFRSKAVLMAYAAQRPRPYAVEKQDEDNEKAFINLLKQDCEEEVEQKIIDNNEKWRGISFDYKCSCTLGEERLDGCDRMLLLCAFGKRRAMEYWLAENPCLRHESGGMRIVRGETHDVLTVTPLCAAALFGQISIMESLLTYCPDADELESGAGNYYYNLPITPLLAAVLRSQWDAAEYLLDHGAKLDMEQEAVKEFFAAVGEESRQEFLKRFGERIAQG